jgi:2-(1,2-epoxy-1,2-dihydrophenyl)acetyl-CoA isomerase
MPVDYSISDGVGMAVLNRPEVLNAFDDELGFQLLDVVEKAAADDGVRCIVITGAGRAFCAGEDLGALAGTYDRGEAPPLGKTLTDRYNPLIRALTAAPKPVIAAVNGVAAGAGVSLALACDYRVVSEHAKFVLAFIKVGLVPDSGAVWFLAKSIGAGRALDLAASGRPVGATEALDLGLVNEVVAADGFEARYRELAAALAAGPTKAFALTKVLVHGASDRTLDEQLEAEVEAQSEAGATADHLEGVQAFLGKRAPKFTGR